MTLDGGTNLCLILIEESAILDFALCNDPIWSASVLQQARQMFRLTSKEKQVAVFVLAAFVLGLVTKCYRDAHPTRVPVELNPREGRSRQPNQPLAIKRYAIALQYLLQADPLR
jgi:hypothetical protein